MPEQSEIYDPGRSRDRSVIAPAEVVRPDVEVPRGRYVAELEQDEPEPVRELAGLRTAFTSTWENDDGSRTVRQYVTPRHFRAPDGTWETIDTQLTRVRGEDSWWMSGANTWSVLFGPIGAEGGGLQFTIGSHTIGFGAHQVENPETTPSVSRSVATYADVWPGVDLVHQVDATGVKEDIVLKNRTARTAFEFTVTGATPSANEFGGADLVVEGVTVAVIPAPTIYTSEDRQREAHASDDTDGQSVLTIEAASDLRLAIDGQRVRVSVSEEWLAGLPEDAFPVVIDPTTTFYQEASNATDRRSMSSAGATSIGRSQVGVDSAGRTWRTAFYVETPPPPGPAEEWRLTNAVMALICTPIACPRKHIYRLYGGSQNRESAPTYSSMISGAVLQDGSTWTGGADITDWITGKPGSWFGVRNDLPGSDNSPGQLVEFNRIFASFTYYEYPPPGEVEFPTHGAVVSTRTPTITAYERPGSNDWYSFRLSTGPGGGQVIESGWLDDPIWTVPVGALKDGVTYFVRVRSSVTSPWIDPGSHHYVPPSPYGEATEFQVKLYLGAGGPSPTDTVGSPPGGTSVPSEGAPSPGESPASETVDLVTGNMALTVKTHSVQALGGRIGIDLNYNSTESSVSRGSNYGLLGSYFPDEGANHIFPDQPSGQRIDPLINIESSIWDGRPMSSLPDSPVYYMVRWTGYISLPAGSWRLGGTTTGGMRIYLGAENNLVYDDWSGATTGGSATFGSTVAGAQQHRITVEHWEAYGDPEYETVVQLWAREAGDPDAAVIVPSTWLTPEPGGLPPGWTLAVDTLLGNWTRAVDEGAQVVLHSTSGETATFLRSADGTYQAPPGNSDLLTVNGADQVQLSTRNNVVYVFNGDGSVASITQVADARRPTAPLYEYAGSPAVLRSVTDPLSGREIALSYGGDAECDTVNPAPERMLCRVDYWDDFSTVLGYNSNGQLAAVEGPGGQRTLFAYDGDSRMSSIRDALAVDYIASGQPGVPDGCRPGSATGACPLETTITYDGAGRVAKIQQPEPVAGAERPERTYTYGSGFGDVLIAGHGAGATYSTRVTYDDNGRILAKRSWGEPESVTVWDRADRPVVQVDPTGRQTSLVYDERGDVTDVYGPAPVGCFGGDFPAGTSTVPAPVEGYLPVADPEET